MAEKVNAYWLGQAKGYVPFHVYLGARAAKVDKPDFSKLKLRVTPNYRAFFGALGATLVQSPPSEIYTALSEAWLTAMAGLFRASTNWVSCR